MSVFAGASFGAPSNALKHHHVGLEEVDDGIWSLYFCNVSILLPIFPVAQITRDTDLNSSSIDAICCKCRRACCATKYSH